MEETQPRLDAATILIVDDHPNNLRLLASMLRAKGMTVRPARSGKQAIAACESFRPDLILLDIQMPGMNGFDVCDVLTSMPAVADVPVIYITAFDDMEHKVKAFATGAVDYITKPFQEQEVWLRVETHLTIVRQRDQLQQQYARLRQLEEMRESLTNMLVHDLKNPLMSVRGFAQLMDQNAEGLSPEKARKYTGRIVTSCGLALDMIQSMLDAAKIDEGQMRLNLTAQSVEEVFALVKNDVQALLAQRRLRLEAHLPESDAGTTWRADWSLVRRVLVNMVTNAAKFSPPEGTIDLSCVATEDTLQIEVADRGPGVPDVNKVRVFDKFSQVDLKARGENRSSGLGLTFCKMAVEAHGGQVGVRDRRGGGAVFWFHIPASA